MNQHLPKRKTHPSTQLIDSLSPIECYLSLGLLQRIFTNNDRITVGDSQEQKGIQLINQRVKVNQNGKSNAKYYKLFVNKQTQSKKNQLSNASNTSHTSNKPHKIQPILLSIHYNTLLTQQHLQHSQLLQPPLSFQLQLPKLLPQIITQTIAIYQTHCDILKWIWKKLEIRVYFYNRKKEQGRNYNQIYTKQTLKCNHSTFSASNQNQQSVNHKTAYQISLHINDGYIVILESQNQQSIWNPFKSIEEAMKHKEELSYSVVEIQANSRNGYPNNTLTSPSKTHQSSQWLYNIHKVVYSLTFGCLTGLSRIVYEKYMLNNGCWDQIGITIRRKTIGGGKGDKNNNNNIIDQDNKPSILIPPNLSNIFCTHFQSLTYQQYYSSSNKCPWCHQSIIRKQSANRQQLYKQADYFYAAIKLATTIFERMSNVRGTQLIGNSMESQQNSICIASPSNENQQASIQIVHPPPSTVIYHFHPPCFYLGQPPYFYSIHHLLSYIRQRNQQTHRDRPGMAKYIQAINHKAINMPLRAKRVQQQSQNSFHHNSGDQIDWGQVIANTDSHILMSVVTESIKEVFMPVRGKYCSHIESFQLKDVWQQIQTVFNHGLEETIKSHNPNKQEHQRQTTTKNIQCPICLKQISLTDHQLIYLEQVSTLFKWVHELYFPANTSQQYQRTYDAIEVWVPNDPANQNVTLRKTSQSNCIDQLKMPIAHTFWDPLMKADAKPKELPIVALKQVQLEFQMTFFRDYGIQGL